MRAALPIVGAIIGLFAGLVVGTIAAVCIVAIVLSAAGHLEPIATIDAAFASRPMGLPALVIVTTYISAAILGASLLYRVVRRHVQRLPPLPRQDHSTRTSEMLVRWRGVSRARRAVFIALCVLSAAVSWNCFVHHQRAVEQASQVPTAERPVSINDHGHELYVTPTQKRLVRGWTFAMLAVHFSTLGYAFHILRFSELLARVFRMRQTNARNA
ncbi:MAG: hypothetical protein ACO1TE_27555 [Prosthecobacter sp.]